MPSNRYDLEIIIRTKKQGDGVAQADKEIEGFGKRLNGTLKTIEASAAAALAAGATFKKAFDLAKEGAQLQFTQEKFDKLAASIGTTADALKTDLKSATNSLVADSQLVGSATDFMSLGLTKTADQTVRLTRVAGALNADMNQLVLTLTNQTTARFDQLGVSVDGFDQRVEDLIATGLSADEAFGEAFLQQAEAQIAKAGDVADADVAAFLRLEAQVQNTEDAFKSWLANGLLPVVEALSGGYGDQVEQIIDDNIATAKSFDELVAEAQKIDDVNNILGGFGTTITGTTRDVREGLIDVTKQIAGTADGFDEFVAVIEGWSAKSRGQFYSFLQAQGLTVEEFYKLERSTYAAQQAIAEFGPEAAQADAIMLRYAGSTGQASDNAQHLAANIREVTKEAAGADAVLLQNYSNLQDVEQGWRDLADAQQLAADLALVDSFKAAADPINELLDAQQMLADSQGEWVTRTVSSADQLTAVNAQLAADLSDDQAKAYREILRTVDEGSAEWLDAYNRLQNDLTQSQRDALIAQQADLAAQPDRLVDVYTGDAEGAEEAQARITAANETIKQSYRETAAEAILAQNGVNAATLDLLVGIGYLTQEQADARLEFANTTTAIKELTASAEFNRLTTEEQANALNALIEGQAHSAAEAINQAKQQTAVNDALNAMPKAVTSTVTIRGLDETGTRLGDLIRQMNDLDGRHASADVTVRTNTTGLPGPSGGTKGDSDKEPKRAAGGPFFAGGIFQAGEGNKPELGMFKRSGRLFVIPGEDGQVFSNQQSQGMLGARYVDNSQISIVNNNLEAAATTNALVQERRRARLDAYMGVG